MIDMRPQWVVSGRGRQKGKTAGDKEKAIPLSSLERHKFDVRGAMGRVMRGEKKVDFNSLESIKIAYEAVFGKDADSRMSPDCAAMSHREAVRNLIAHKGGIVDETFRRRVADPPVHRPAELGRTIEMGGGRVADAANLSVRYAMRLLAFADGELSRGEAWAPVI